MSDLIERLNRLPAAAISDIQRNVQATYLIDPAIHSIVPGAKAVGPAFTVLARAGSIITVHKALIEAPQGSVLVVGGETAYQSSGALFGKIMSMQAMLHGIQGLVVDGAVRDVADLRELKFPVFARGSTPHVGLNRTVGETQVPVPFGGVTVNPGDYIVGDDDGVVIIPASLADQIVTAAEDRIRKESEHIARMKAGEHIADLIGFRELIYPKKK